MEVAPTMTAPMARARTRARARVSRRVGPRLRERGPVSAEARGKRHVLLGRCDAPPLVVTALEVWHAHLGALDEVEARARLGRRRRRRGGAGGVGQCRVARTEVLAREHPAVEHAIREQPEVVVLRCAGLSELAFE
eukprot:scaffold35233_cov72-Phaeocystis_antarctica.AAC.1